MFKGGQKSENLSYPDDQIFYYQFAKKFGWTPEQVDEQPAGLMDWLLSIAIAESEVESEKSK